MKQYYSKKWLTMVNHGQPMLTVVNLGQPWLTMVNRLVRLPNQKLLMVASFW